MEPILASGILMASFSAPCSPTSRSIAPTSSPRLVLSAGLAVFLYKVSPTGGADVGELAVWLVAGPIACAVILVCMTLGRNTTGPWRGASLGVAAGISFGIAAVLTKALMHYLGNGVFAWVNHWEPYGLAVFASAVCRPDPEQALQTGALGAAVGAQEAMAPISAAIFGLVLLHEEVAAQNGIQIFLVSCSLIAVLGGIAMLARAEERLLGDAAEVAAPRCARRLLPLADDHQQAAEHRDVLQEVNRLLRLGRGSCSSPEAVAGSVVGTSEPASARPATRGNSPSASATPAPICDRAASNRHELTVSASRWAASAISGATLSAFGPSTRDCGTRRSRRTRTSRPSRDGQHCGARSSDCYPPERLGVAKARPCPR